MSDKRLLDLAGQIADGAVDWSRTDVSGCSERDREVLDELRLVGRIADMHAQPPSSPPAATGLTEDPGLTPGSAWGPLVLRGRVGRGTFGEVYRAWDARLDREVALKLLHPRTQADSVADTMPASAIVEEGRLMARIRHPGVVTVHGADQFNGRVGVWMEFVPGRTLEAGVRERGPLPAAEVLTIGIAIAEALAAVHDAGLIHRDVKAQNIIREPGGRTVLMDFGTGIELGEDADTESLAGTPLYLAPEVLQGQPASTQSDIYSLGVLLYHLATTDFPVRGRTLREVRKAHDAGERRSIRDAAPALPRALARTIDRALAPSPSDRFQNAGLMTTALRQVRTSAQRRWQLAAVVVTAAVLITATAMWMRSSTPSLSGVSWTEVPPALADKANLRGPTVDGRWVPCTSPWGTQNVAICNLIDFSVRRLRDRPAGAGGGQLAGRSFLSPDGTHLAYVWTRATSQTETPVHTLHVINIDNRNDREMFRSDRSFVLDRWIAGSDSLLIREGTGFDRARALLIPAGDGPAREIARLGETDFLTDLSPDGRMLVVERLSLDREERRLLFTAGNPKPGWAILAGIQ